MNRLCTYLRSKLIAMSIQSSCRELVRLQSIADDLPQLRKIELDNLRRLQARQDEIGRAA